MTYQTTQNSTDIDARCGFSCEGICNMGALGCTIGSIRPASIEELEPMFFWPIPESNGSEETVALPETGDERCADCMEVQGKSFHCDSAGHPSEFRWMIIAVLIVWIAILSAAQIVMRG